MKTKVNLLVDGSGSMGEDSKKTAAAYVLNSLQQAIPKEQLDQFLWVDTITPLEKLKDVAWVGSLSKEAVRQFFKEHKKEQILLLSDGAWSLDQGEFFSLQANCSLIFLGDDPLSHRAHFSHGRLWFPENLTADIAYLRTKKKGERYVF